jgi:hypothetical protein
MKQQAVPLVGSMFITDYGASIRDLQFVTEVEEDEGAVRGVRSGGKWSGKSPSLLLQALLLKLFRAYLGKEWCTFISNHKLTSEPWVSKVFMSSLFPSL